jgi:hypothetical protein
VRLFLLFLLLAPFVSSANHWNNETVVETTIVNDTDCRNGAMALAGGMHSFSLNSSDLQGSIAGATMGGCDALSAAAAMVINKKVLIQGQMCISAGDSCFGFSAGMRF